MAGVVLLLLLVGYVCLSCLAEPHILILYVIRFGSNPCWGCYCRFGKELPRVFFF